MNGSIRRRSRGSWELTLDVGYDARGKRKRMYRTVRGTKADAERELRKLLTQMDLGVSLSPGRVLLRDWIDRWLTEWVYARLRPHTIILYEGVLRRQIRPKLGHIAQSALRPTDISRFESELSAAGLKPGTVGVVRTVLSSMLSYAVRMELLVRNPCSVLPDSVTTAKEVEVPDVDQVNEFLAVAKREEPEWHVMLHVLVYTGLRLGEVLALNWSTVFLEGRYLVVESSLVALPQGNRYAARPKTASGHRRLDLDAGTVELLREHREARERRKLELGDAHADIGVEFPDGAGGYLGRSSGWYRVKKVGRLSGVGDVSPYTLRHFHATVAIQTGQNIVVVSRRLGHAKVSITTDVYAHVLPGWQRDIADAFPDRMSE